MDILLKEIFIGKPKTVGQKEAIEPMEREWTSGIFKEPVHGPIWVGKTNVSGDGQADLKNHGGPEKAIFAYPSSHYLYWQEELKTADIRPGGMGENFSLEYVKEEQISIGDTFQVGEVMIQVSQPRQPCWKPARRFKRKELALLIQNTGKTGWYFRVLQEGTVQEGDKLILLERPHPEWTIAQCNYVMHVDKQNMELAQELANIELLATNWRKTLADRVDKRQVKDIRKRVLGPNE
ncbi:MOSC domain-containing protein YiiM [Lederbergia galactosidilyticus]|uniref:MOSC domain-containing protein n=1 Tax=Lederbergia galactosidilytica TaxID=217031 RepID=UPI001D600343|nr:MOSC domain-containing protein [Lederbergia galactosidilytica]MBP1914268.1 MOSC domain-containing protein YiiM [Lederbergia galactosidilytica]